MNILEAFTNSTVSQLNDPFDKDFIRNIHFHINKGRLTNTVFCSATVEFENENTKGSHKIEAEDFNGLVNKVNAFIKTL